MREGEKEEERMREWRKDESRRERNGGKRERD